MSKLSWAATFTCPAAMGGRPRFATGGHKQPGESWRFFATFERQKFAAAVHRERLAACGVRRSSTANIDRQAFAITGSREELAADCQLQRRATPEHRKQFAGAGAAIETGC